MKEKTPWFCRQCGRSHIPFVDPCPIPNDECPKCGIKLDGVMGYVCVNSRCPVGLGSVQC